MVDESLFDKPPPYKYLIDTCALISQKDRDEKFYRHVHVTLWNRIDELIRNRVIVSCSEVREEIYKQKDEISEWFKQIGCYCFEIDEDTQLRVIQIVNSHRELVNFTKNKSSGDAFLIATAMKWNLTIITEEDRRSSCKIPMVCKALGQDCRDIYGLCDCEDWQF
jgi:hypothetical protein